MGDCLKMESMGLWGCDWYIKQSSSFSLSNCYDLKEHMPFLTDASLLAAKFTTETTAEGKHGCPLPLRCAVGVGISV